MPAANCDHPIETPVRRTPLKIGTTTASKLDSVGDLEVSRCGSVINGHARVVPMIDAAVEVSVVAPSPFR
jgi:hypothetical protein